MPEITRDEVAHLADLARVADTRPGEGLRFAWVSAAQGEATARAAETLTRALVARIRAVWPGGVDEDALYRSNLVSGVVDARRAASPDTSPSEYDF